MRVEGVSVMQPGNRQIIFAVLDDELNDGTYTIFALWQGKFKITGNKVDRGVAKEREVNESFLFDNVVQLRDEIMKLKERESIMRGES